MSLNSYTCQKHVLKIYSTSPIQKTILDGIDTISLLADNSL